MREIRSCHQACGPVFDQLQALQRAFKECPFAQQAAQTLSRATQIELEQLLLFLDWLHVYSARSSQVSLGGMSHALTPLAAASPHIHVFDAPAKFLGALWLPYRRDHDDLKAAIDAAGAVDAVFGHADVVRPFPPSLCPKKYFFHETRMGFVAPCGCHADETNRSEHLIFEAACFSLFMLKFLAEGIIHELGVSGVARPGPGRLLCIILCIVLTRHVHLYRRSGRP